MNSSHMSPPPRPPHTPPDRPQPDRYQDLNDLLTAQPLWARARSPAASAARGAWARGQQPHRSSAASGGPAAAPSRSACSRCSCDRRLAPGWGWGHGYGWGQREFVRALLGTGGGHTSFAMLFSQPVAWSTWDRVRVRVKVIGFWFWLFGHSRRRAAPWCTWVRGRSGRLA